MRTMSVIMPRSTSGLENSGMSLGEVFGNAISGPTPLQMLQIDKFKKSMAEMDARKALIESQTGLANEKTRGESLANENLTKMRTFASDAATAEGNAAVNRIPHPPLVLNANDPAIVEYNQTYPAEAKAAKARAAYTFGVGDGTPAQRADAANSYAGGTMAQFGSPEEMRRGATLMGHNPGKNDYFGPGDPAIVETTQSDIAVKRATDPKIIDGRQITTDAQGNAVATPVDGMSQYGTGKEANVIDREIALTRKKEAGALTPDEALELNVITKDTSRAHTPSEGEVSRNTLISTAEAVKKFQQTGDPKALEGVNAEAYRHAFDTNNKDEIREINGRLVRIPGGGLKGFPTPEQIDGLLSQSGGRPAPAPGAEPPAEIPPANTDPVYLTPPKPLSLNEGERKSIDTAQQMIQPAAFMDSVTEADVPTGLVNILASNSALSGGIAMSTLVSQFQTPQQRRFLQNAMRYLDPELRFISGAAVFTPEYVKRWLSELPTDGDTPDMLASKRSARAAFIRAKLNGMPDEALNAPGGINEMAKFYEYDRSYMAPNVAPSTGGGGARTWSVGPDGKVQ